MRLDSKCYNRPMIIKASHLKEPVLFWVIIEKKDKPNERPYWGTMEACSPNEVVDRIVSAMNEAEFVGLRDLIVPVDEIGSIQVRQVREKIY